MKAGTSVTWVNHASFVLDAGDVRLICDPWISGTAFNKGWRHCSPSVFEPADFSTITHIWFSHQHPDHFAPSDLRRIPPEIRSRIVVLYHETIDKKVIRYCESLGFKAQIELRDGTWLPLSPQLSVLCGTWFDRDSWLAMRTPDGTILNVNDCVIDSGAFARSIAKQTGPVRVLMTQFSYAEYHGNVDNPQARRASAEEKLRRIALQTRVFDPEYVVPFASYIYWCHADNFHMNDEINHVIDVGRFIESELQRAPVVLYPGDTWRVGEANDWMNAARRYESDLTQRLNAGPDNPAEPVPLEALCKHGDAYLNRLRKHNPLVRFVHLSPTVVDVTDLDCRLRVSESGVEVVSSEVPADIRMRSDSLLFCLRTPWGSNALRVNGRFESVGGRHERFFRFFKIEDWADHGYALRVERLPLLFRATAVRVNAAVRRRLEHVS